jgi:RING finger protein 113A
MFKKAKVKGNIRRKRDPSPPPSTGTAHSTDDAVVLKPEKRPRNQTSVLQSTTNSSSANSRTGTTTNTSIFEDRAYAASSTAMSLLPGDMGATAENEIETPLDTDQVAILERSLQVQQELAGKEDDKLYRGMSGYAKYNKVRDTAAGNALSSKVR